ncbi:hypothetical protein CTI14_45360, partial [Methylobacterium radiotolerans]
MLHEAGGGILILFGEGGTPRIFAARRLVERTGVEHLVEAMALVRDVIPSVVLRIAGIGPREAHIRELIDKLGLQDHVELLGRVPEGQL